MTQTLTVSYTVEIKIFNEITDYYKIHSSFIHMLVEAKQVIVSM